MIVAKGGLVLLSSQSCGGLPSWPRKLQLFCPVLAIQSTILIINVAGLLLPNFLIVKITLTIEATEVFFPTLTIVAKMVIQIKEMR